MTSQQTYDALQQTIAPYLAALPNYTEEQFSHKEAEDIWSLGQMYEHICLASDYFFLANTLRCLDKRKGQEDGDKNAYGEKAYKYNSLPPIKVSMKDIVGEQPQVTAQPLGSYEERLKGILDNAAALMPRVATDEGNYKTMHPAFGWLNALEWFQMLEFHTRHHHRQKAELEGFAGVVV